MPSAPERLRRILCSAAALLLSAVFAFGIVAIPLRVTAAAHGAARLRTERPSSAGGAGSGAGGSTGTSGIWAGVSYYWGEWSGSRSTCTWNEFVGNTHLDQVPDAQPPQHPIPGVRYVLYIKSCADGYRFVWVPQLPPRIVAQGNSSLLSRWLPLPTLHTSPPPSGVVVKVPMWFWTDATAWHPVSVTAWIPTPTGPLWVTTTATPVSMELNPGDGRWGSGTVRCMGPGVPWIGVLEDAVPSPMGCDYTYRHSSVRAVGGARFVARLTIVWNVTWRSSTGAGGSGGQLRTSSVAPITVRELEGVGIP